MLWRESYAPEVRQAPELPIIAGVSLSGEPYTAAYRALIVATHAFQMTEAQTWARLMASAKVNYAILYAGWTRSDAEAVTPPSRWDRTYVLPPGEWSEIGGARAMAIAYDTTGTAMQLVIGPPTEEVWEAFEALVTS